MWDGSTRYTIVGMLVLLLAGVGALSLRSGGGVTVERGQEAGSASGSGLPPPCSELTRLAKRRMAQLAYAIRACWRLQGHLPDTYDELTRIEDPAAPGRPLLERELPDPWGYDFIIQPLVQGRVVVRCVGPDGLLGTGDDIVWRDNCAAD